VSDDIKRLIEIISDPALNNSVRLGILLALYGVKSINFTQLLRAVEIPKSSLFTHLQVLEEAGYVRMVKRFTALGPRTFVEITEKGERVMREYSELIRKLTFDNED
jgi:DNA-binding MarR family transcriptional regulator